MHNSLFIRDQLRRTNADPLRLERRDPHRLVARDPDMKVAPGDWELSGAWRIRCEATPEIAALIEDDARAFLMKIGVSVEAQGQNSILFRLDESLAARQCNLSLQSGRIEIKGGDIAGLWAGLAHLEWEMKARRGPFLPHGEYSHCAGWQWQISQGPWGGNYSVPDFAPEYLSDDAFRLYAHYGVNSMMIYGDMLCYTQSEIFPELNCADFEHNLAMLKDAARRALRYGVQFAYLVVGPKLRSDHPLFKRLPATRGTAWKPFETTVHCLCSSDENVLAFYDEFFTRLFAEVPELAGSMLIVAGESFYHCRIWTYAEENLCPRCGARTTEEVISDLMQVCHQAATKSQPRAWTACWAYTTGGWKHPDRLELIKQLPPEVAVYHHIEKDQSLQKDGYVKNIWDYSIDFTGPSENMIQIARLARETGHDLFIKTETGIGLETFQFPYVPAMQHLADKWQRVRELEPRGVQQSWLFFGMFGSRAEELGLWAAYRNDLSRDEFLHHIAVRDFGPDAADRVLASWEMMSDAVTHLPCVCFSTYYIGPSFMGPCHPLVPKKGAAIPDVFHAYLYYLQEGEETFSRRRMEESRTSLVLVELPETAEVLRVAWDDDSDGWHIFEREYSRAVTSSLAAWQSMLEAANLAHTAEDKTRLREETLLTELFYRTMLSCKNTLLFLRARRDWESARDPENHQQMQNVAREEKENALAALPIYEAAPWLDLSTRTDGIYSPCREMINEKVRWIDEFLNNKNHYEKPL